MHANEMVDVDSASAGDVVAVFGIYLCYVLI